MRTLVGALALGLACSMAACSRTESPAPAAATPPIPAWEADNPITPLPDSPLGADIQLASLPNAPTPEQVRLGRWLFYDTRLSGDGSVSCATCHRPEHAFSEPTPHSTGIRGQAGGRKSPSFVNAAVTLYPNFFWDGRAQSLEEQALGPIANPIEMGATHESMVASIQKVGAYAPYFKQAFGSEEISKERVAQAIAAYEKTRMSGNSPVDRWRLNKDESAVPDQVKQGYELFFGKAACNQCHLGNNYTDSRFHNLGVGYDPRTKTFKDEGRSAISKDPADLGAFKTPTLRDVAKHAPYMHDGSVATLREVVELYDRGGEKNPNLDPKIKKLNLTPAEVDALVAFMEALSGEGYMDHAPKAFPQAERTGE
ncbi:MAG: c-type cytochrome [Acidobacteria bacterium]|nr:c-type cytochrome [Acidobacteriota bacterium]